MTAPASGYPDVPFRGPAKTPALSPREREVLTLLARGLTKAEVASRLGVSEHTVRYQTANLRERLGTSSVMETLWRLGWVRVPGLGDYEHELLSPGHVPGEYRV